MFVSPCSVACLWLFATEQQSSIHFPSLHMPCVWRVFDREWNGTEVSAVSDSCQRHVKVYIQDKLWNTASYYAFCKVYEGWQQICPVWLSCSNSCSPQLPFCGSVSLPAWWSSLTDAGFTQITHRLWLYIVCKWSQVFAQDIVFCSRE